MKKFQLRKVFYFLVYLLLFKMSALTLSGTPIVSGTSAFTVNTQPSGNALNFDGISNYMRIPHNAAFNFSNTDEFSVTLWVNSTNLVSTRNARIVAKRGDLKSTNKTAYEMWGLNADAKYYPAFPTTHNEATVSGGVTSISLNSCLCF